MSDFDIKTDDLVALVISEFGGDKDEIRSELNKIIDEIYSLDKGQSLKLKGLGTFKRNQLDLIFQPEKVLHLELNSTYAGMQPILITPPSNEEMVPTPLSKTELFGIGDEDSRELPFESDDLIDVVDDTFVEIDETEENFDMVEYEKLIKDFHIESDSDSDDVPLKEEKVLPVQKPSKPEVKKVGKVDKEEKPVELEQESEEEINSSKNETTEAMALQLLDEFNDERKGSGQPAKKTKQNKSDINATPEVVEKQEEAKEPVQTEARIPEEDEPNVSKKGFIVASILVAAVVVLALVAVLVFQEVSNREFDDTTPNLVQAEILPSEPVEEAQTTEDSPNNAQDIAELETSETSEDIVSETESVEDADQLPVEPQNAIGEEPEIFGLYGEINDTLTSYYSIILMSVPQENSARQFADELKENEYRAFAYRAVLNENRTTWRVGIGQFETVSDATNTAGTLPEPYRSNNFIIRIN